MAKYSDEEMDAFRLKGDEAADLAVRQIMGKGREATGQFWKWLIKPETNSRPLPLMYHSIIQAHFPQYQSIPKWVHRDLLKDSHRFFQSYTQDNFLLLGMLALPYCYAAGNGARVLEKTGRLQQDGPKRLLETARFIFDVMEPKAFYPNGFGWKGCLKTRLLHAAVRYSILEKDKTWDIQAWGIPVNQEDMAGTNMAFSFIILEGLDKMGYSISRTDKEAYIHAWNLVGEKLGIVPALLPQNWDEARTLVSRIRERQIQPSEAGRALAKNLLDGIENSDKQALPKGYPTALMNFLLDEELIKVLDIPKAPDSTRLAITRHLNYLLSRSVFFDPINQIRYRFIKDRYLRAS